MALTFDANYYLTTRPDVFNYFVSLAGSSGLSWPQFAEQHYNNHGRFEGSNPNAIFNTVEYLTANPDVAAAGVNPFQHYLTHGVYEGRAPSASFPKLGDEFDADAYLAANSDLAGAGIDTPEEAYAHFVLHGQFENRPGAPAVDQGIPGSKFALTAGADPLVGTANNDVFTAQPVDASGAAADTFSAFDSIDGGAGVDTLNIYTTAANNRSFPTGASVKNVEIVNIYNTATAANLGDASKFEGVRELWQHAAAAGVTNLSASTTAGFKDVDANVSITPAAGVSSAKIALSGYGEGRSITVDGAAATSTLSTVSVSGTVKDTNSDGTVANIGLAVNLGKDVQTLTVNTDAAATVTTNKNGASTKDLTTVDASGSKGGVTYDGTGATTVSTIKGGSGNDVLTINTKTAKDNAATAADETVSAVVQAGAGNDSITVNTTGDGTTTIEAGAGNDSVTLNGRGSGKLTVDLGAGNDTFNGTAAVNGTDVVDGGEGTDTLLLNMVGASNIGAFTNFEVFDAAGLGKALDVDILASKNTVTEFVASADVGAGATLTNVGAGVGYRITGDTVIANAMTLTQKTAGVLTVTLDIDETTAATTTASDRDAAVTASNATSIKAVFDASFVGDSAAAGDNTTDLDITGLAATSLEVVSGGANAVNNLDYIYGTKTASAGADGLLTSVVVTGDRAISLNFGKNTAGDDDESNIATVDGSGLTGALTFNTSDLKASTGATAFDGGVVKLGAGADVITITNGASIENIGKGTAEDATLQGEFDVLTIGSSVAQAADADTADVTIKDGKLVFKGAGPATLDAAIALADAALATDGDAVVFEYIGNSYVFINNDTAGDTVVKLAGTTGLNGLDEVGTSDQLYVF